MDSLVKKIGDMTQKKQKKNQLDRKAKTRAFSLYIDIVKWWLENQPTIILWGIPTIKLLLLWFQRSWLELQRHFQPRSFRFRHLPSPTSSYSSSTTFYWHRYNPTSQPTWYDTHIRDSSPNQNQYKYHGTCPRSKKCWTPALGPVATKQAAWCWVLIKKCWASREDFELEIFGCLGYRGELRIKINFWRFLSSIECYVVGTFIRDSFFLVTARVGSAYNRIRFNGDERMDGRLKNRFYFATEASRIERVGLETISMCSLLVEY